MAKKTGTKDMSVEDFQLLAPDNTELLAQARSSSSTAAATP